MHSPLSQTARYCQQGSALISALFIMTLVAIAATAMSMRLQIDIERTRLTILSDNLYLASQMVPFWAMSELSDNKKQFTLANKHGKVAQLARSLQHIDPLFTIYGELYDLQARFNLNNLIDRKNELMFFRLIKNTTSNLTEEQQKKLVLGLEQWLSPYTPGRGNDEWIRYYTTQKPPYYPGQQRLQNNSEFRLLRNVDATTYLALQDYITALPETTPININTATIPLLKSLTSATNDSQLEQIITARGEKGITSQKSLNKLLQKLNIPENQVTINSSYFLSIATVISNDLTLMRFSILKRSKAKNGKISVQLISESLNSP